MISRITGILIEKTPPSICVDVQGVGYDIAIPMHTFYNLPAEGQPVTIFTHLIVREDAHLLYGFQNTVERAVFLQLIKVNGIGARTALAILSGLSVQELQQAIQEQNSQALQKVPGIGKKTAERLLLELRGKIGGTNVVETPSAVGAHADVLAALVALGYAEKEAALVVKKLPVDISVSEGIRQALKWLH